MIKLFFYIFHNHLIINFLKDNLFILFILKEFINVHNDLNIRFNFFVNFNLLILIL